MREWSRGGVLGVRQGRAERVSRVRGWVEWTGDVMEWFGYWVRYTERIDEVSVATAGLSREMNQTFC